MKAYILVIIVATIINFINEKKFMKNEKKKISIILAIISLIVLCIVAGVRNIKVGTDVTIYVTRLIELINNSGGIVDYLRNSNSDLLFALTVYVGYWFKDIGYVLFLIELLVAAPIYIYAYKERDKKSFTLVILVFLLTMYCTSFNLMRQSIAISMGILSYHYFDKRKYKNTIILLIIAILFHKTAFVFALIYYINYIVKNNKKNKVLNIFLIIIMSCAMGVLMDRIVYLTSYSGYIDSEFLMRNFSLNSILKKAFWIAIPLFAVFAIKDKDKKNNLIIGILLMFISLILTICSFKIPGTGRLGYYFNDMSYFLILFEIPYAFKQKKEVFLGLICIVTFLWWNMTAVPNDPSKVYPYKSDIVQWLN